MTLLAAISLGLKHGHALDSDILESVFHFIQLERLDDGFNLLHGESRAGSLVGPTLGS
ncbi:hypothetical protein D3C74_466970 [compost metagenome]